jgi:hypothetical protein
LPASSSTPAATATKPSVSKAMLTAAAAAAATAAGWLLLPRVGSNARGGRRDERAAARGRRLARGPCLSGRGAPQGCLLPLDLGGSCFELVEVKVLQP